MFEAGTDYLFNGDTVTPCFVLCKDGSTREYANEPFTMKVRGKDIQYRQGVISPLYKEKCRCISVNPLIFALRDVESPIIENKIKHNQAEIVRKVLTDLGRPTSETDVYYIMEVAIPWAYRDKQVTEDKVLEALTEYLKDSTTNAYHGSIEGHGSYMDTMTGVFTVIFGHKVAYAMIQLNDTGDVSVSYHNGKFTAYYCDIEMNEFISSIESMIGDFDSEDVNTSTYSDNAFMSAVNKMSLD